MIEKVKSFVEGLAWIGSRLDWNQKMNIALLVTGFAILAWKIGFLVSIGFTCLAIYSRPDR